HTNAERLRNECPDVDFTEVKQQFEAPKLSTDTIIIDALFGTGITKPLSGGFASLVQFINAAGAETISIDMPSGLMCEDNTYNSPSAIVR
ncbi:NAD(P)H-hydrate epimerase, partial [Acinetobacter baumannii]|nr:NAD(P)H-hydrate epimerase [Acinetobacter baumannii]